MKDIDLTLGRITATLLQKDYRLEDLHRTFHVPMTHIGKPGQYERDCKVLKGRGRFTHIPKYKKYDQSFETTVRTERIRPHGICGRHLL